MAAPAGYTAGLSVGHAFLRIVIDLNAGVKEDCFGFYPKTMSVEMFTGGSGLTKKLTPFDFP
jgi:hypothetical protein